MKSYLVTGGAGFIGSHIARRLLQEGARVWVLDNFLTGQRQNVPEGANVIEGDIASEALYEALPEERFDAVFHLAAQSSGPISGERPALDVDINAKGTLLLLGWCAKRGISRFLHASSQAVYGTVDGILAGEDHPCRPCSFYGITKLAAEHYIRVFADEGLQTTVFRMCNVYGPGQNLDNLKQGMVSIFLAYLTKQEPILVMGSLDRYRDLIYIDDVVNAWMAALDNPTAIGKTYNLGSGRKTTVRELIHAEIEAFGYSPETYPIVCAGKTHGDTFGVQADISLLRRELDWQPKVSVAEGIQKMADWARGKQDDRTTEDSDLRRGQPGLSEGCRPVQLRRLDRNDQAISLR